MEETTGRRVRASLERHGWRQKKLASRVGMTESGLSKAINGTREFTSREIAQISDVLRLDPIWLITGEHDRLAPQVAARHSFDNGHHAYDHDWTAGDLHEIDALILAYQQADLPPSGRLEAVRAELGLDTIDPVPGPTWADCRRVASWLTEQWEAWHRRHAEDRILGLGRFLTDTLGIELCVVDVDGEPSIARTHSLSVGGNPVVVLARTGRWYSAHFGVLHEVAHLLFGALRHIDEGDTDSPAINEETLANGFAADVLLPARQITSIPWDAWSIDDVAELLWQRGCGAATLNNRIASVVGATLDANQSSVRREWRARHPDELAARESVWRLPSFPPRLVARHQELVDAHELPPGTLAWLLDVAEEDLQPESPSTHADRPAAAAHPADHLLGELGLLGR